MREEREAKRVAGAAEEAVIGRENATEEVEASGEAVEVEVVELITRDEGEAKNEVEGRREPARR